MESSFLTFLLVSSSAIYFSRAGVRDWDDVVVATEDMPTILLCTYTEVTGAVTINWMMKSHEAGEWKLVLSANEKKEFSGGSSKASMRLIDPNFQDTGIFSLFFLPKMTDSGYYSCSIKQRGRKLMDRIIMLAILTVTVSPARPVLQHSTLRLIAEVNPTFAITKITWIEPGGNTMKSEKKPNTGTVAKLPQVQTTDGGVYVCMVYPWGNSSGSPFEFNVDVTVNANNSMDSFTNIIHGPLISTATHALTSFTLTCPSVQGDFVRLYWLPPDSRRTEMKRLYEYDRWRESFFRETAKRIQLAGRPYNAATGSFSFLLTPGVKDGGLYTCEVFLNDNAFSQRTLLSVLKVKASLSSSKLELGCLFSEVSQVQSANWKYQNTSRELQASSSNPGNIVVVLPVPVTSGDAGNYTCTLLLKNGQTISAIQAVTLPREESVSVTPPSLLPSLSALLLLVPLVAAAVGVLLWRQKHISDRGMEPSVHSGDNIYDNPEDIRQAPLEGSVYMDLKPRGEDDVYKELERYEHCQS